MTDPRRDSLYSEPDGLPEPERPPRPMTVELAAALMITSGLVSTLGSIQVAMALSARGEEAGGLLALELAIGVGTALLGILVRFGKAWLVAVNVAAIAGFLEFTSASAAGVLFGAMDVIVVLLLMRDRPWFAWPGTPGEEDDRENDADESAEA